MKKIFMLLAGVALSVGSCIEDKGNYDYSMQEVPVVTVQKTYKVDMAGEGRPNLVIVPEIEYAGTSKLDFLYTFWKPETPDVKYYYPGAEDGRLDNPMTELGNGTYSVLLTVTVEDDSGITVAPDDRGMKYYYEFTVALGTTIYITGTVVLADDDGATRMHFIVPDGLLPADEQVLQDVYAGENDGAAIPGRPIQIEAPMSFMGGFDVTNYYIVTDNGGQTDGVIVNGNTLAMQSPLMSMFMGMPASTANPGRLLDIRDGGNTGGNPAENGWAAVGVYSFIMDDDLYVQPAFMGPGTIMLTPAPVAENIQTLVQDRAGITGGSWGWDPVAKCLRYFSKPYGAPSPIAPGEFAPSPQNFNPAAEEWNPRDVGLDLVTLQFWNQGGWLFGSDGGTIYVMGFQLAVNTDNAIEMSSLTKDTFPDQSLITANTKWAVDILSGVVYFSSGNRIYRYNPATPSNAPEQLVAELNGEVSMLKMRNFEMGPSYQPDARHVLGIDFNSLDAGSDGHLYRIDLSGPAGKRGSIASDYTFTGIPVDIYNRVSE